MGRSYLAVLIEPFLRQPLFPFSLSGTAASCVKSDPSASRSDKQQLLSPNAATLFILHFPSTSKSMGCRQAISRYKPELRYSTF
jgi:hypothetical protein